MVPSGTTEEIFDSFESAYNNYTRSASNIENNRIRPKSVDIFEWLLDDKESIEETDNEMESERLMCQ
jgi:hypothetical protein